VRVEIQEKWEEAGELYYKENQSELQDLELIDTEPKNYPVIIPKRPKIGCRALVRRSLQVLNSVLHEMEDWKEDVRLHSTKLLMQIVIHSEDHLATKYYDINAVLCKTCQDQEADVAKIALQVAALVGYFTKQETWSKYAFEETKIRQNKTGCIKCLNALYQNSYDEKKFENLSQLMEILLDSSICHNNSENFQSELIKLMHTLLPGVKIDDDEMIRKFYIIILKTTAISFDNISVRDAGMSLLKLLSENCNAESLSKMHETYLKSALKTLEFDKGYDEHISILCGIICICGFEVNFYH
jgi:dynein assembly factor 5, axonemal